MNDFVPHPWFVTGHLQTLGTRLFQPRAFPGRRMRVALAGGDALAVIVNEPPAAAPGAPVIVLVHGMTGSSSSAYMIRIARAALARGAVTVRMNMRNCGEGAGLSRLPYHSGRSDDLRAVLAAVAARFPERPIGVIGYSLGGNVTLKMAGELREHPVPALRAVASVAAPVDLAAAADALAEPRNWLYDQYFVRSLVAEARLISQAFPDVPEPAFPRRMTVRRFDDLYTAPRSGFLDAADYYAKSSSGPLLARVPVPTLLITAGDDPFVPIRSYEQAVLSPQVQPILTRHGGHCAYISRRNGRTVFWAEERALHFILERATAPLSFRERLD